MSIYIGFVTKDLVILATDRKFLGYNDEPAGEAVKLKQINKNTWGAHIGSKFFGEKWLEMLGYPRHQCLLNPTLGPKLISYFMRYTYFYHSKKMKKYNLEMKGFTGIVVAGFKKNKPFIYTMDNKDKFFPEFIFSGSVYSCIEREKKKIDSYIEIVTRMLGVLQKEDIDRQKIFLRAQVPKILKYLSEKHDHISSSGDMVFITREGSAKESF